MFCGRRDEFPSHEHFGTKVKELRSPIPGFGEIQKQKRRHALNTFLRVLAGLNACLKGPKRNGKMSSCCLKVFNTVEQGEYNQH